MKTRHLFICAVLFLHAMFLNGETLPSIVINTATFDKDSPDIDTLIGIKGKILLCDLDTLFIINKPGVDYLFYCDSQLTVVKNMTGTLKDLNGNLSDIKFDIDSVYKNMNSLSLFIKDYKEKFDGEMSSLKNNKKSLEENLSSVEKDLNETKQKLKMEKWSNIGKKLLWGAGGFVVGVLTFAVVSVVD